jgi:uncharacterized protein (TIGR03435 family)
MLVLQHKTVRADDMPLPWNCWRKLLPILITMFPPTVGRAQSLAAGSATPAFEVASVKVNVSGDSGGSIRTFPGGRFDAVNSTMQALMRYAYDVRDFQIEAAPRWFDLARYDVVAKAPRNASTPEFRAMVQRLLAERFALLLHRDTRELPVYALVIGKHGVRMKKNTEGDTTISSGAGEIRGQKITVAMLVNQLSAALGRPAINKTDLTGTYDVTLRWSPQVQYSLTDGNASPESGGSSIFAAVQEQLGLQLKTDKGPVEVLVIDSANKLPLEN